MKKYIQLCLVLVALTCFLLMAFYEHKYTNLQTVIRFMQWPAKPSEKSCSSVYCKAGGDGDASIFHWIEVAPGLYTYSVFLHRNQTRVQIISLRHMNSDNSRLMCSFFHEGGTDISNVYVRTLPVRQFGDWNLNLLVCPSEKEKKHVELNGVGVSITDSSPDSVLGLLEPKANQSMVGPTSVVFCIKPLAAGFSDAAKLLEFIELAKLSGAQRLVFYHRGLSLKSKRLLIRESRTGFVQLLPFFVPLGTPPELVDSAAQLDCFFRSTIEGNAKVIQMKMNDFFVPLNDKQIQSVLLKGFSGLVTFKTHVYCLELNDDIVARTLHFPFLTLKKTKRLKDPTIRSLLVLDAVDSAKHLKIVKESLDPQKISTLPSTGALSRNQMVLKHYGKCRPNRISRGVVTDTYMMKFKDHLFKKMDNFLQG